MNIGVLTFNQTPNYGAYWQLVSTLRFLKESGYNPEVINYSNSRHIWIENYRPVFFYRHPARFLGHFLLRASFTRARQALPFSKRIYGPTDFSQLPYDAILTGSDIVWCYELFGIDSMYFGAGLTRKNIAHAASFGWISSDRQLPDVVVKGLRQFDHISVRDWNTMNLVTSISRRPPQLVVDPVLIADFTDMECRTSRTQSLGNYLLIYAFTLSEVQRLDIIDYAKRMSMKTIAVGYYQPWCDKNMLYLTPGEWLTLFRDAYGVVTSTFHGTLFAVKYRKKLALHLNPSINLKIAPYMKCLLLDSRIYRCRVEEVLNTTLDYDQIESNLRLWIDDSKRWLLTALQ